MKLDKEIEALRPFRDGYNYIDPEMINGLDNAYLREKLLSPFVSSCGKYVGIIAYIHLSDDADGDYLQLSFCRFTPKIKNEIIKTKHLYDKWYCISRFTFKGRNTKRIYKDESFDFRYLTSLDLEKAIRFKKEYYI